MPNFHVGTINASPPSNVLVGSSSGQIIAENINRQGLVLVNLSSSTVYLGLDANTAVLNAGIVLMPNGGAWVMDEYNYNNRQVTGIAHSANNIVTIQEFIR